MAITREFFYTYELYLSWDDVLSDVKLEQASIEEDNEIYPDFILLHREKEENTPSTVWSIRKGNQLQYRIRFYKRVTGASASENGLYWLNDGSVKDINITSTYGTKLKLGKVNTDHHSFSKGSALSPKNTDGDTFWFSVEPTQTSFNLTTPFTLTCDIVAGNPDSQHPVRKGWFPTVKVTSAKAWPATPSKFLDALYRRGNYASNAKLGIPNGGDGGGTPFAYDFCTKKWVGYNICATASSNGFANRPEAQKFDTAYVKVTSDTKGAKVTVGEPQYENMIKKPGKYTDGPGVLAARKEIANLILSKCGDSVSGNGNREGTAEDSVDLPPSPPQADLRWNPPTHYFSRSLPYGMRMDQLESNKSIDTWLDPEQKKTYNKFYGFLKQPLQTGRIFQDSAGAASLNTNPDNLKLPGDVGPKIWGFRFMYNPTTFNYSSSSNNSVDWTAGSKAPGLLLAGNQQVNFEIYINRIADMATLTDIVRNNHYMKTKDNFYERELDVSEVQGLLARGTEYDIEFLYRVLNGDPLKNPLLFNPAYNGVTADFGYTTGMPCWLVLHDNLRYFGSVSNFTVNHAMFTPNMVPMLTTVNITFSRYPALWGSSSEVEGADSSASLKKMVVDNTTGTGTTTP